MSLHLGHRHGRARRESSGDGREEGREDWRRGKRGGDRGGERVQIAGTGERIYVAFMHVCAWSKRRAEPGFVVAPGGQPGLRVSDLPRPARRLVGQRATCSPRLPWMPRWPPVRWSYSRGRYRRSVRPRARPPRRAYERPNGRHTVYLFLSFT